MPRTASRRQSRHVKNEDDDDILITGNQPQLSMATNSQMEGNDDEEHLLTFTQQCSPDLSQHFPVAKSYERSNLESMSEEERKKIIVDTSRLVLFKALAGEPIERLKCVKQVGVNSTRVSTAVWEEVNANLSNVFGMELVKPPHFMEKNLPKKFGDRYFCINGLKDESGEHNKSIHSIHKDASIEKGLLMVILALIFCKGNLRPGFGSLRWISEIDLYRLLHSLDESLPQEPPNAETSKKSNSVSSTVDGITPRVDMMIHNFCNLDYLWKVKDEEAPDDRPDNLYTMGPRAALEVGRRQIVYFCSEILDEQPDPTMLQELDEELPTQTQATTQGST